jgi:hypothetical protein
VAVRDEHDGDGDEEQERGEAAHPGHRTTAFGGFAPDVAHSSRRLR